MTAAFTLGLVVGVSIGLGIAVTLWIIAAVARELHRDRRVSRSCVPTQAAQARPVLRLLPGDELAAKRAQRLRGGVA